MWKSLSPTLLALVLGSAAPLAAATSLDERDQTALAVVSFTEQGMRLPAKRWLDRWLAGKYTDDGRWIEKVLRYRYADRFAEGAPKPEAAELIASLKALRTELDKANRDKALPEFAGSLMSGGEGALERIKRDIVQIMDPNLPPPTIALVPEKKDRLQAQLKTLCEQSSADFQAAKALVEAHVAGPEKKRWDMKDEDPKAQAIDNDSVGLRVEALQALMTAHAVLRDAAQRGQQFGIDPTEAKTWLRQQGKNNIDMVYQWDFAWGQANPYMHFYCLVWMCEAYKQGVRDVKDGKILQKLKLEDLEDGLRSVIYTDMKPFSEAQLRNEIYGVRIRALDHYLRWCLEMGDAGGLKRGVAMWHDFLELAKHEPALSLSRAPKALLIDRGFLNFTAARLLAENKDLSGAMALINEVSNSPTMHPGVKDYAKRWALSLSGAGTTSAGPSADAWSQPAIAEDPGSVLILARELLSGAEATDSASLKFTNRVSAAAHLRNAFLGLESATYADQFVASAPGIVKLYVATLQTLGLRQHAVVAGIEGLTRIVARRDLELKAKRPNPWQGGEWQTVLKLASNTYRLAQSVYSRNRGFGPMAESARTLLISLDPNASGPSLALEEIYQLSDESRYDEAIERCTDFLRKYPADKYPAEELRVFQALVNTRLALLDKLGPEQKDRAAKVASDLDRDNQKMRARIEAQLGDQTLDPERRIALEQARSTILSAEISQLMRDKNYDEVINRLGDDFWKRPPASDRLSATMLSKLCYACYEKFNALKVKPDAKSVADATESFLKAYGNYTRQSQRLAGKGVDRDLTRGGRALAATFQGMAQLARLNKAGDARLPDLAESADRAFADLFEPLIDATTKPDMVRLVADTLWDIGIHDRAAKLFARYRELLEQNDELQAFKKNGKAVLDGYEAKIAVRQEFKTAWSEIADLAWDSPEDRDALANGLTVNGKVANYTAAIERLRAFRSGELKGNKERMDAKLFAATTAAVESFEHLLVALRSEERVIFNLATAYREAGDMDHALPLLLELYRQDPTNTKYATGFVEATLKAVKDGTISAKDPKGKIQLEKARDIVTGIRIDAERDPKNRDGYWLAFIQGMELTAALGDIASINETLAFLRMNKSDLSRELVKPAVEIIGTDGKPIADDTRARRPRNMQAVQLAQRYLELHKLNGVKEKPVFRIDDLDGLTPPKVLVNADAPTFTLVPVKDENLMEVTVLKAVGTAAVAPAVVPAPTAAPVVPPKPTDSPK